jgi:hypothetical protein
MERVAELPARPAELESVEVDEPDADLPAEVALERAAVAGVVASVCATGDLEEVSERIVVDIGSQMGSASLELCLEDASGERFNVFYFSQRPRPAEKAHALVVAVTDNGI